MDEISKIFRTHGGYARMHDLRAAKIHYRTIVSAVKDGQIEKIKRGLYKLSDYPWDSHSGFIDIQRSNKNAIICLTSALEYYDLATINPSEITIAVPHNTDYFKIAYPPVRVFYYPKKYYELGVEVVKRKSGEFKIYNKEKTICDAFRYRNKIGEDLAIESLKNYLKSKKIDLNLLQKYAIICNVKTIMIPYLRVLVG
jgi:predicted transcriptional regulator of viral defense system